ncbi:MAG: TonB-dependent receptor plug domain-containing protein, partial [Gemmatimonadota bacterium]
QVERLPGLAEADVLRAVEVLPGVISTSDFSASFNVRGGAADQNLILLDGVPIYNPFHLGGLFGVFNADMVERTELLAGGFPPRYGGRVSSVLDVRSDAGDGRLAVDAGVSLLASRAVASAGVPSRLARRLGFDAIHGRVSARRSYFDVLLGPFFDFPYHLTDFQGVVRGWTGGGAWTVTGYTGADVLDLRESEDFPLPFRLDWGNDVGGVRWAGGWGGAELEARLSSSRFQTGIRFPDFEDTVIRSRIREVRAGVDVRGPVGGVRLGAGGELARLEYDNLLETGGTVFGQAADHGWLGAVYGQLVWQSSVWLLEAGLRSDYWAPRSTDASWEPAPRLAVKRFLADGSAALKVATGRYTQVLHSLRDEEVPIGIDVWVTAGDRAPVVVSDQLQVGWEQFLDGWSGSVEAYYRTFDGVIAVNPADDLNDPGDDFVTGDGTSWGADLVVRREPRSERTVDGWIAVSFLRAERTFPDPLDPEGGMVTYPPIYDRRLDVDLVLRYPLPGGVEGGLRFNFGSGLPYTRPVGAYPYYSYEIGDGQLVPQNGQADEPQTAVVLGDRNGERYPAYHRLDLSFRKEYRRTWGSITPFLDVLNVYNRRDNVLFYFFDYAAEPPVRTGISMLPILPTLGAEVRF